MSKSARRPVETGDAMGGAAGPSAAPRRRLLHDSALNLAARVLAVLLGAALMLLTARLGTVPQGAFALFVAAEAVLLAALSGFGVVLARQVSHHGHAPGPAATAALVTSVMAGLGLAAVLGIGAWLSPGAVSPAGPGRSAGVGLGGGDSILPWLALAAPLLFVPANLSGVWLGQSDMKALARLMLAPPVLTLMGIGVAWAANGRVTLVSVLAAWVVARGLVGLGAIVAARRAGWLAWPEAGWGWIRGHLDLRFIATIGLTNLVSLLNYKVDLFLVEHFLGRAPTGVYSIAVALAELMWLVSSAVTTAAYARIGSAGRAQAAALAWRAMRSSVLVLLAISPLLWAIAAWWVPVLLGEPYRPAMPLLAVLLPGVALYGGASALSAWFTNHAGRPMVPARLAALSLVINVAVSLVAIPRLGPMGGALATTLSYTVTMIVGAIWFARASGLPRVRPSGRA